MQGRCGDYCGNMGGIEQQTMVGSTGKGVGAHGFCCGPSGGGSAGMDGVVDMGGGNVRGGFVDKAGGISPCRWWQRIAGVRDLLLNTAHTPPVVATPVLHAIVPTTTKLETIGYSPIYPNKNLA